MIDRTIAKYLEESSDGYDAAYEAYRKAQAYYNGASTEKQREEGKRRLDKAIKRLTAVRKSMNESKLLNEGGTDFYIRAKGTDAKDAFRKAVEYARHMYGHRGYTGTIAEKDSFVMISLPKGKNAGNAGDYANELIDKNDPRVNDKWGPAGCIELSKGEYLFFGWASS